MVSSGGAVLDGQPASRWPYPASDQEHPDPDLNQHRTQQQRLVVRLNESKYNLPFLNIFLFITSLYYVQRFWVRYQDLHQQVLKVAERC